MCACDLVLEMLIRYISVSWFKLILTFCYVSMIILLLLSDIQHFVYVKDIAKENVYYIEYGIISGVIRIILLFCSTWFDFILTLSVV